MRVRDFVSGCWVGPIGLGGQPALRANNLISR